MTKDKFLRSLEWAALAFVCGKDFKNIIIITTQLEKWKPHGK